MNKFICVKCGAALKWGDFAHNQDTCFDCFEKEVKIIIERVDQYPSWLWDKRKEHKDILNWMMELVAETYGYEY